MISHVMRHNNVGAPTKIRPAFSASGLSIVWSVLAGTADRSGFFSCGFGADLGPVIHGVLRPLDGRHWMFLQILERDGNRFFELRVVALAPERGIEIHFDVGRNADVLDIELARCWIEQRNAGRGNDAAIH